MSRKPKAEPSTAGPSKSNDMAYDPDQDPEVRRGVRKDYRNLQTRFDGEYTSEVTLIACILQV